MFQTFHMLHSIIRRSEYLVETSLERSANFFHLNTRAPLPIPNRKIAALSVFWFTLPAN
jgi:hypothetical protein